MIRYKLTDPNGKTRGQMAWAKGVTNRATGSGKDLCTDGWVHVYDSPAQAAFMQPVHVPGYTRLWEVECPDEGITDGTKRGVKEATVLREIRLPRISRERRVEIGIRCVMTVCKDKAWRKWARGWINGSDRSKTAANAATAAAAAAAAYAADAAKPLDVCGIIKRVMKATR